MGSSIIPQEADLSEPTVLICPKIAGSYILPLSNAYFSIKGGMPFIVDVLCFGQVICKSPIVCLPLSSFNSLISSSARQFPPSFGNLPYRYISLRV